MTKWHIAFVSKPTRHWQLLGFPGPGGESACILALIPDRMYKPNNQTIKRRF
jgi:hypothetical protein